MANRIEKAKRLAESIIDKLNASRNLKTEIKDGVTRKVDDLLQLVLEAERECIRFAKAASPQPQGSGKKNDGRTNGQDEEKKREEEMKKQDKIIEMLKMQKEMIEENQRIMKKISKDQEEHAGGLRDLATGNHDLLRKCSEDVGKLMGKVVESSNHRATYADVVSGGRTPRTPGALRSVVVSSKEKTDTSEKVIEKIHKAIRESGQSVKVDRIKKGRDQKVVLGCKAREEAYALMDALAETPEIEVHQAHGRCPRVELRYVLASYDVKSIYKTLVEQNASLFGDIIIDKNLQYMELKYVKSTRYSHLKHVVCEVSPFLWRPMVERGHFYIGVQRVVVRDSSPLVQCTNCLGYGHSRRICREKTTSRCVHCGGEHLRKDCADWKAGVKPTCSNCVRAKLGAVQHSAFSNECAVRKKSDYIARSRCRYD